MVLFSQRSKLYDEGGRGRARALRGSGVAKLIRHSSGEVRFLFSDPSEEDPLCQSPVEQPYAGEVVGGPLSSLTTIPTLRNCWWCSRQRNLPCSSRMRSKQPRRHSLNDGFMRAAAVLVGERRAFRYCYLGKVLLFMVIFSCVHCRVGVR